MHIVGWVFIWYNVFLLQFINVLLNEQKTIHRPVAKPELYMDRLCLLLCVVDPQRPILSQEWTQRSEVSSCKPYGPITFLLHNTLIDCIVGMQAVWLTGPISTEATLLFCSPLSQLITIWNIYSKVFNLYHICSYCP